MPTDRLSTHSTLTSQPASADWLWKFWFLVPLYPYQSRRTLRQEIVPDQIWSFDQIQGVLHTVVPIRMTVIALKAGGLLVYAPVAPTPECIRLVRELEAEHGAVRYILLPTASGLEHKVFVAPFARRFPQAQVFVTANQWSYPFNLPLSWLGFPKQRTQVLPSDSHTAPFADEFDYAVLHIDLGRGAFEEVALLHKQSGSLIVTDTVLSVPPEPPAIVQLDPYPLLFHARDSALDPIKDSPENRRQGWQRIALFAIYFQPNRLKPVPWGKVLQNALKAPDRSKRAYWGLYPFQWQPDWQQSFDALCGDGRPFVAPILQLLILDHAPAKVTAWANQIASWQFDQIIPAHFSVPIAATPQQFRQIFTVLEPPLAETTIFGNPLRPLPESDVEFIKKLEETLDKRGITSSPTALS
jgi:hypothetical protein